MGFKLDVHYLNAEGQPAKAELGVGDDLDRAQRQMTAIRTGGLAIDRLQLSVGTAGDAIFGAEQNVLETPRLQMIPAHRITQLTLEEL
jgi:hypothetical protein